MALPATELRTRTAAVLAAEELIRAAHQRAIQAKPAEMAAFFQKLLGQKWTAYISGVADPKAVGKWARGERMPRDESLRKLRHAYHIAVLITMFDDFETARAWFTGMNPFLDHRSPAWVIASKSEGSERAMDAALAFISYG